MCFDICSQHSKACRSLCRCCHFFLSLSFSCVVPAVVDASAAETLNIFCRRRRRCRCSFFFFLFFLLFLFLFLEHSIRIIFCIKEWNGAGIERCATCAGFFGCCDLGCVRTDNVSEGRKKIHGEFVHVCACGRRVCTYHVYSTVLGGVHSLRYSKQC